jgi:hypothetical protein
MRMYNSRGIMTRTTIEAAIRQCQEGTVGQCLSLNFRFG